jgi:pyrroline-5-carboxylate reductase
MLAGCGPLLLVGAGKMGGAMLDRWLQAGLEPATVTLLDPYLEDSRRAALRASGVALLLSASEAQGRDYKIVVLAVKPQAMESVLGEVVPLAQSGTAIVSIAAGIRLGKLQSFFRASQPIIRAMPNTPAQLGQGMTVAVANGHASKNQRAAADALFSAVGKVAWIEDEDLLDAVTAVSGSGPAYVFLLAECLGEAARRAGLPDPLADLLARQTVAGAGALLGASPLPPATLRANVTSPAGTTAAALQILMAENGLQQLLDQAVEAARKRSAELG